MTASHVRRPDNLLTCSMRVLIYLCENSREDEIEQYRALTGVDYDPEEAAFAFYGYGPMRIALHGPDMKPIAAGGYHEVFPGVWQSWMVGTAEGWEKCWPSIHRGTRWLMQQVMDHGAARRLQTNALASRKKACEWYERLGMKREGVMRGFGAGGEDVVLYGMTQEDVYGQQR